MDANVSNRHTRLPPPRPALLHGVIPQPSPDPQGRPRTRRRRPPPPPRRRRWGTRRPGPGALMVHPDRREGSPGVPLKPPAPSPLGGIGCPGRWTPPPCTPCPPLYPEGVCAGSALKDPPSPRIGDPSLDRRPGRQGPRRLPPGPRPEDPADVDLMDKAPRGFPPPLPPERVPCAQAGHPNVHLIQTPCLLPLINQIKITLFCHNAPIQFPTSSNGFTPLFFSSQKI